MPPKTRGMQCEYMKEYMQHGQQHIDVANHDKETKKDNKILDIIKTKQSEIKKLCKKDDKILKYHKDEAKYNEEAMLLGLQDPKYHKDEGKQNQEAKQ